MTQTENLQVSGMDSKFSKIALTLLTVLLLFLGPTYVPYLLTSVGLEYFASIGLGFVFFVVGLVMLVYLIRKKVIT
ncbi:MAG: hypothetical protein NWE96_01680 [Candidatus Bathyarchaeota archaeon]|nr:hypothetical protein [Candidatus Bathyarchaeota archaeon]